MSFSRYRAQYLADFLRYFERSQGPPGMERGSGEEERREREKERERDGNALKKNGEKSDARISSNPCANVAQWNSLEGPPLARVPLLSILWSTYKGSAIEKKRRRRGGRCTTGRVEHRCPRIGIFRIIFFLFPFARLLLLSSSLLFAIHPLARPSIHRFALCNLN